MYDINSDITTSAGLSADQLRQSVSAIRPDHGFQDFQMFVDAEHNHGINALFATAHAIVESAWGTSHFARTRNNLFGFNAIDSNPDKATSYPNQAASVDAYGVLLQKQYLTPGGQFFNGPTPHGVFVKYSSSHDSEAQSVVKIMNQLLDKMGTQPAPAPAQPTPAPAAPAPPPQPSGPDYIVQPGDTLGAIAAAHGLPLDRLIQLNPQIADPNVIHPGDVVHVSGFQPPKQTYTVKSGDTLGAIASRFGTTAQALFDKNRAVIGDSPNLIKPGQVLTI